MRISRGLAPERVFHYFEEISAIPRGSGNMEKIAQYCMDFAKKHSLKAIKDDADNVIIFKDGSCGGENAEPLILQGHLDMVCQKTADCEIDFLKDGLELYIDGDFLKAKGTTLGADNGIAVAMILSVLESDNIPHPPIEAVFTTDEEIGLIGAGKLDKSLLKSKRMINLDSEQISTVTVSCAGGSDFRASMPFEREKAFGTKLTVLLNGLKGGHSGDKINSGRVNSDILAGRVLNYLNSHCNLEVISVNGGDKGNAIPVYSELELCTNEPELLKAEAEKYINIIKEEIAFREPDFTFGIIASGAGEYEVLPEEVKERLIFILTCIPNGVMEMSAEIKGLVETSLNLGVLETKADKIIFHSALRSNKKTALSYLEERLKVFYKNASCDIEAFGHYPPWEYNANSKLVEVYKKCFSEQFGYEPEVKAIHAGLECGVFADAINGFDCISVGPEAYDIHTVNERLSISSTESTYKLLLKILEVAKNM